MKEVEELMSRVTRAEFWLLNALAEYSVSASTLFSRDADLGLDRRGPLVAGEELLDAAAYLVAGRKLYCCSPEGDRWFPTRQELNRVAGRSAEARRTFVGLTPEGGDTWEAFAAPEWNLYLRHNVPFPGESRTEGPVPCVVEGGSRGHIQRFLDTFAAVGLHVGDGDIHWEAVVPLEITYWKSLAQGWRVTLSSVASGDFQCSYKYDSHQWLRANRGVWGF